MNAAHAWPVALCCLLLLAVPAVEGHAVAQTSSPAEGQRLDTVPQEVVVSFTEPVFEQGSFIEVWSADGVRVDQRDLRIEHGHRPIMRISLPADLPDGAYRVVWQTYSESDGHIVGSAIGFAVGGFLPPTAQATDDGVKAGPMMARVLQYAGMAVAAGAFVRRWALGPALGEPGRRSDLALVGAAALYTAGSWFLLLNTAQSAGLGMAEFVQGPGGRALLQRLVLALAVLALSAIWLLGPLRSRWTHRVVAGLWVLQIVLAARLGHASSNGAWAVAVQAIHAAAAAAWVGGLVVLVVAIVRGPRVDRSDLGRRFGRVGLWSVSALGLTGLLLGIGILDAGTLDLRQWAPTVWGRLLLVKIGLFGLMLALAAWQRKRLAAWAEEPPRTWAKAAGSEAAIGVVVLLLAAGLMSSGAPVFEADDEETMAFGAQGRSHLAAFEITPVPQAGALHTVRAFVTVESTGDPVINNTCGRDAGCIKLRWWADHEGEERAQKVSAEPEGDGWWRIDGVLLVESGNHTIALDVQTATTFFDSLQAPVVVAAATD